MLPKYFKQDNFLVGLIIGVTFPVVFYGVLFLLDLTVVHFFETHMLKKQEYLFLVSIAINLFAIKYYFVNLQYDKTGRGVLLITFVFAILFFIL